MLISLHYYDINYHPERISMLKPFNVNHNTFKEFEINNPNVSLTIFDEHNNVSYMSKNNSTNKVQIVKINNYIYAAIKPLKNKFVKLNKLIKSFSHLELRYYFLQRTKFKDIK